MVDKSKEEKSEEKVGKVDHEGSARKTKVKTEKTATKTEVAEKKKTEYKHKPMLKKFKKQGPGKNIGVLIGAFLVVLLGIGSGWFLSGGSEAQETATTPEAEVIEENNGKSVGISIKNNDEDFDEAEGILESGGIDGEGTHHLVREGGPTKYVYLTSTTLDLESFVGKTVLVKGETMTAQSAPWLMDVWVIKELK